MHCLRTISIYQIGGRGTSYILYYSTSYFHHNKDSIRVAATPVLTKNLSARLSSRTILYEYRVKSLIHLLNLKYGRDSDTYKGL